MDIDDLTGTLRKGKLIVIISLNNLISNLWNTDDLNGISILTCRSYDCKNEEGLIFDPSLLRQNQN